ncbi:uncharacterized protein [Argopecten irradians]|uniref:uncharacterized protein n=1 Tax=Argopecten irradians TaxID=31199 RepID=UPI0037173792
MRYSYVRFKKNTLITCVKCGGIERTFLMLSTTQPHPRPDSNQRHAVRPIFIENLLPLVQRNLPAVITTTRGLLTQSHNMAMQTLDDVLGNCTKQMPYTKSGKFNKMKEGNNLLLRNFIVKPDPEGSLLGTSNTRIFPTGHIEVQEPLVLLARKLVNPPEAEVQPLVKALASPLKKKVSVRGQVVQEEVTHEVSVKNQPVSVKHVYIKDQTNPRCRISLWRDCAECKLQTGDYVTITNVVVNNFRNEVSLSTTSQSTIKENRCSRGGIGAPNPSCKLYAE